MVTYRIHSFRNENGEIRSVCNVNENPLLREWELVGLKELHKIDELVEAVLYNEQILRINPKIEKIYSQIKLKIDS